MNRLWILWLALIAFPVAGLAADASSLRLAALRLKPGSLETSRGPAEVTITFTLEDDVSEAVFFEVSLADPSGIVGPRASVSFAPARSVSNSISVVLPERSIPGKWTVANVFALDSAGNSLTLDTEALAAVGLPTTLEVLSSLDNTAPKLDTLSFTPRAIDTSLGPSGITLTVKASDDLSGVKLIEATFLSPSGTATQRVRFDLTPSTAVNASRTLTFPRFSEAGLWALTALFLADSAGNTLALDTDGLAAMGISESLKVVSVQDSTPPRLAAFGLSPSAIYVGDAAVNATVSFQITDDLSGATACQVAFVSPSGHITLNAVAGFAPSLSYAASADVVFPSGSESGVWSITSVFVADAAGNTATLTAPNLAERGFPYQITISNKPLVPSSDR